MWKVTFRGGSSAPHSLLLDKIPPCPEPLPRPASLPPPPEGGTLSKIPPGGPFHISVCVGVSFLYVRMPEHVITAGWFKLSTDPRIEKKVVEGS